MKDAMNQCLFTVPGAYVLVYWFILQPLLISVGFALGWYGRKREVESR